MKKVQPDCNHLSLFAGMCTLQDVFLWAQLQRFFKTFMSFENPLFLCLALSGAVFIIVGFYTSRFPPKKINPLYGYRTRSSMRSQERWEYAQRFSSREMIRMGVVKILLSFIGLFFQLPSFPSLVSGISILLILIIIMFIRIEKAIGRKFREK